MRPCPISASLILALSLALAAPSLGGCGGGATATAEDGGTDAGPDGPAGPAPLALGDVVDVPAAATGGREIEVVTEAGTEKYLAVLYSPVWTSDGAPITYTATATGGSAQRRGGSGARAGAATPAAAAASLRGRPSPAHLAGIAPLVAALRDGRGAPARPLPRPAPPVLDEVRTFKLLGDNRVATIEAKAAYVGTRVAFWLDQTGDPSRSIPPADISSTDLGDITAQYEGTVLPREHTFFGQESDVDANGMVFVLMSGIVNENDGPTAYFFACDLLAPTTAGCPYSNQAEVLYLTPPNAISPPYNTVRAIVETMAHETNHMVFFGTKYLAHDNTDEVENLYLQEGWAALAQDLTGYQRGNKYVAWYGQNLITDLSAYSVLEDGGRYDTTFDGAWRGGSYLLQRYLYDQAGGDHALGGNDFEGDGIAWLHGVFNSGDTGLAALRTSLPRPLEEMIFDFYTALAVTNRGPDHGPINAEARYNYRPVEIDPVTDATRGHDAYGEMNPSMAMTGPHTVPLADADGQMLPTGVEYLEVDATTAGAHLVLHVDAPAEWDLRVRLCRIE